MDRGPRNLVVVLGDQLDPRSAAFDGFDPARDVAWMAEVAEESTHVWTHQARIALFLAAMRHHRDALRARGWTVHYRELTADGPGGDLRSELAASLAALRPGRVVMVEAGEWRVARLVEAACAGAGVPLETRIDRHFFSTVEEFRAHAAGRRSLRLEYWYRELRRRHRVLVDPEGEPTGGQWNYDVENREPFGPGGPPPVPAPRRFPPDATTRAVIDLVRARFGAHPGRLDAFDWPVTPEDARLALDDFVVHRLAGFGPHQDAMAVGHPWLWHSRLSAALNLKLLDPRDAVAAAVRAHEEGRAPLASVEGFVRQVLGWREYVRGVYWLHMPGYERRNALEAKEPLPGFYWDGQTPYRCLADAIGQTLEYGYAHHIQRLMVTGLYGLLLGVDPEALHRWYLAVYVDAVEWVELPNTVGMSQFADGGLLASKPYIASGAYLSRMGDACRTCPARPDEATGPRACPFTTLYWDFLDRHEERFAGHPRLVMQVRNLRRLSPERRAAIREAAAAVRADPSGRGRFLLA